MPIAPATYEHLAELMLVTYEQAEQKMMSRIAKRLAKGVDSPGWTERKYAEVRAVKKEITQSVKLLKKARVSDLNNIVTQAYSAGQGVFKTDAEKFTDLLGISHLSPNAKKVAKILAELDDRISAADRMILRKANDAYKNIVGQVAAQVATGSITVREAVQQELHMFADKGITSFIDKSGNSWEMATYAEMATITAIENATLAGYIDTMQEYGFDLAVISSHEGSCPLCMAWEGVIVSVSGSNKKYPSLEEAKAGGAFHPRCLHHLSTYYEGVTKNTRSKPRAVQPASPGYSARQKQRYYERMIRRWKRRMAVAVDPQEERAAYAHVRRYQGQIRELIESTDEAIPRKYWREGGIQRLSSEAKKLRPVALPR